MNNVNTFKKAKWYWQIIPIVFTIIAIGVIICTIIYTIIYSNWSNAVGAISAIFLLLTAVITIYYAKGQLSEYRKEQRNQLFLNIIEKMSSIRERENRAIIYQLTKDDKNTLDSYIVRTGVLAKIGLFYEGQIMRTLSQVEIDNMKSVRINEAIEETVSCLERVCFFLQENGDLKDSAPKWINSVIYNMRERLKIYIEKRWEKQPEYGEILLKYEMPVTLVEKYNPDWTKWFERIKSFLDKDVVQACIRIEHTGSTSIPGMIAKPIIDLILVIAPNDFEKAKNLLVLKGYLYEGDLGITGREAFKIPDDKLRQRLPQHHLYVCAKDSIELKKQISFREYLKIHKADAGRLSELKWSLAKRYNNDREAYMQGKAALCEEITQKALEQPR